MPWPLSLLHSSIPFPQRAMMFVRSTRASSTLRHLSSSNNKPTVLVTSATGRIGKEVVARLASRGDVRVRAAVYTPSKAPYLYSLGADEVAQFDLADPSTYDAALEGVSRLYSASLDPLLDHHLAFSKHLGTMGGQIEHVVRVSCMVRLALEFGVVDVPLLTTRLLLSPRRRSSSGRRHEHCF